MHSLAFLCFWAFAWIALSHNRFLFQLDNQADEQSFYSSSFTERNKSNSDGDDVAIQHMKGGKLIEEKKRRGERKRKTLHMLNCIHLRDNKTEIVEEWEVNFKSVLSNAPLDNDLHIHVIANHPGSKIVEERVRKAGLHRSKWRNRVFLTIYDVESKQVEWTKFLDEKTRGVERDDRISIGGYYRLLAYQVIDTDVVDELVYMDTDVVILTNLNDLLRNMNTTHEENQSMIWQYAATFANSGFMVLNMPKFHRFWELVDKLPSIDHAGDQCLLSMVVENWPNETYRGLLPDAWNVHLGHGWRRGPHNLLKSGRNVGMLHFTGAWGETYFAEGIDKYCNYKDRGPACKNHLEEYRSSWGLAEYYVRLTWDWLIYFESSKISYDEVGFNLNINTIAV